MLDIKRPMLSHCRLQISFDVKSSGNGTRICRRIDRKLREDSTNKQCRKQIDRFRRESVCLGRAEAGRQITVVKKSITAAQHCLVIAKHVERKTETRAEI